MVSAALKCSLTACIAGGSLTAAGLLPAVNEAARLTLPNSVHPRVAGLVPAGRVQAALPLERMLLVLKMSDPAKADLAQLLKDQQDPASPSYHQWLTPAQFGQRFGASATQLAQAADWLAGNGLNVTGVAKGGLAIAFSGTSAQVERTFRTAMMEYQVDGVTHHANASSISVPAALAGFVAGPASLNDFRRKPQYTHKALLATPQATSTTGAHYLGPLDMTTIYDFGNTNNGSGVTVAVLERTDPNTSDFTRFKGYQDTSPSRWTGSITVQDNGIAPGLLDQDERLEAELDAQWAAAAAPGATVRMVVSASSYTTDGVDLSALYAVDSNVDPVLSMSFGQCEADLGTSGNLFFEQLWAQAAAQGQSVFVSSGDDGVDTCADGTRGVNGLASPPYCTAVGGTQFNEGGGTYWTTPSGLGTWPKSAVSHIPEVTWNEPGIGATGGGVSIVYSKPSWQTGTGVPGDGMRDVPDVALNAAAQHDPYLVALDGTDYVVGGTSVSAPIWAGIMALVVQQTGSRQGNANPSLYALRAGTPGAFYDITSGTNSFDGVSGASAGTGYDACTGLGSPWVSTLLSSWVGKPSGITVSTTVNSASTTTVTVNSGTSISFAGSSSPAGLTYTWNFGDGTISTGATASHAYTNATGSAQTYDATFTASDGSTSKGQVITVHVNPSAVSAAIAAPFTNAGVLQGIPIAFRGSASTTGNPSALTYHWDFGDGGTASTQNPSHTYSTEGAYAVTFTATDTSLSSSSSASLEVVASTRTAMDTSGSGTIDVRDLLTLAGAWGTGPATSSSLNGLNVWCDLNADGAVNDTDLNDWIAQFDVMEQ